MRITDYIYVNAIDVNNEWTLGIHYDKQLVSWQVFETPEDEIDESEFELMNRITIGFLLFSISFMYYE